jgi:hypothetical protein
LILGASLAASDLVQGILKGTLEGSFKSPATSGAGQSPSPTHAICLGTAGDYLMLGASLAASDLLQTFVEALTLTK